MKRNLLLMITFILIFTSSTNIYATYERFDEETSKYYDTEQYYADVWDSYNFYMNKSVWPYVSSSNVQGYISFVKDLNNHWTSSIVTDFLSGITSQSETKDLCIDVLVNLLSLMNYELDEVMDVQVEADTLKELGDYTMDVVGIINNAAGLSIKANQKVKLVIDSIDVAHSFTEMVIQDTDDYERLDKILLNYKLFDDFLTAIISHSKNKNLTEAAIIVKTGTQKTLLLKLEHFSNSAIQATKFAGYDIFFDKFAIDLLKEPNNWSTVDRAFVTKVSNVYDNIDQCVQTGQLALSIGVFAGDMLIGLSDMINRVNEMRVLYEIHGAIVEDTENMRDEATKDNFAVIDKSYHNMRFLMYVNSRGNYCLYNLLQYDSQLLSLLFHNREKTEEWYQTVKSIHMEYSQLLDSFYPKLSNYLREYNDTEYGLLKVLKNKIGNEVLSYCYDDYDNDGMYE